MTNRTKRESSVLEQAAAPTRERIDRDRETVDGVWVRRILRSLRHNLFRPGFNVEQLRAELGLRDNTVPGQFRAELGVNLAGYLEDRRLETSCRMLLKT
ncbi:MAG: helix-turn-helix transcriptional regulator, partial [Planctomycetota bacterium]